MLKTDRDKDTKYTDCFHFELTEKWANELLRLVLIGQKQATSSSLLAYQVVGDRIPQLGDLSSIIINPFCIMKFI